MRYEEFVSAIKREVELLVGTDMRVEIHTALKNNGKERVGLAIRDEKVNVMPAIYLEEFYCRNQRGVGVQELAESIVETYEKVRIHQSWETDIYLDYNAIKSKLACKIVNYEKNKSLLQELPHVQFLDLAVVFYLLLTSDDKWASTMLVREEHIEMWGVSEDQLYCDAMDNVEKILPARFQPMTEVISEVLEVETKKLLEEEDERMYVLSNETRNQGAACIMYKHTLHMIGDMLGENYYVLPSSVHEVIIVPESKAPSEEELRDMVRDVNDTQLEAEEILSNKVYFYRNDEQRLRC